MEKTILDAASREQAISRQGAARRVGGACLLARLVSARLFSRAMAMQPDKQAVLDGIRRGYCVGETEALEERVKKLKAGLTAGTQRLAEDLYAKSSHFIMEYATDVHHTRLCLCRLT